MSDEENPHAGQGPVLLDIGDDIGALVVTMPAELDGVEVEIRPSGSPPSERSHHDHYPDGDRDDPRDPDAGHGPEPDQPHLLHVAVVARPAVTNQIHSLVFPELVEGHYELYQRPNGPVELTVTITGGQVTEAVWPET